LLVAWVNITISLFTFQSNAHSQFFGKAIPIKKSKASSGGYGTSSAFVVASSTGFKHAFLAAIAVA